MIFLINFLKGKKNNNQLKTYRSKVCLRITLRSSDFLMGNPKVLYEYKFGAET